MGNGKKFFLAKVRSCIKIVSTFEEYKEREKEGPSIHLLWIQINRRLGRKMVVLNEIPTCNSWWDTRILFGKI